MLRVKPNIYTIEIYMMFNTLTRWRQQPHSWILKRPRENSQSKIHVLQFFTHIFHMEQGT